MQEYTRTTVVVSNLSETNRLAEKVAVVAKCGDFVALRGDFGAGKTTFARYFIYAIAGHREDVASPTFNLVLVYSYPHITIWHFDLFRLIKPEEVWELGIEDALADGISLVEWPDRMLPYIPKQRLEVDIEAGDGGPNSRVFVLTGYGEWRDRISAILDE